MDIPDLTAVDRLDAESLLAILTERYEAEQVYTYIGPILVAVNPLKALPIYGEAEARKYREAGSRADVPPHVYRIAHEAFSEMVDERMNQSVVVSGESGAGKTETTKHIVRMVSWASAHALGLAGDSGGGVGAALEAKLLATNPILEALGNCRTLRNDNSSRFGKFVRLQCSGAGAITGCALDTYLLEKSRVSAPGHGERNFHIFYQLLAGNATLRPELAAAMGARTPATFTFLSAPGAVHAIKGVDDAAAFDETRTALRAVGLADADVALLVAALLLLGNIRFEHSDTAGDGQGGATMGGGYARVALGAAAAALACNPADIESGMCSRRLRAGTDWRHSVAEANSARDALAKALYAGLFDALVKRVNSSLGGGKKKKEEERVGASSAFFGVLDIFGFENFAVNSLEQLCINYANEKLQGHFNAVVFKAALADYAREGVHVAADLPFTDNQAVVEAIEARPSGIVWVLQDTCSFAKATDESFADAVEEKLKGSVALTKQKGGKKSTSNRAFTLRHYAGDVTYEVKDFLHKNKDPLHEDLT
ncbi:P-loop containing nucleoside triphosphate hydrolase protein, partial [Pavlovales sp. CCMP2436]